jgi:hypothetical protein
MRGSVMDFRLFLTAALLGVTALAAACSDDGKPCDPDQKYDNRVCKPGGAGGSGGSGGGDEDAATDALGPTADAPEVPPVWGKACNMPGDAAVDCVGASSYCVARPGATEGYCSAIGCDTNPGICPIGWSCFPIPGVVAWCAKP